MRIGEVHSLLRQDYPTIELSKIRYYEDKGLVQPARSRKGYRLYSERDVTCLREAIRLAQEEFVPLRVVRGRLIDQGLLDDAPTSPTMRQVAREASANAVSVVVPPTPAPTHPASRAVLKAVPPTEAPLVTSLPTAADPAEPKDPTAQHWSLDEFMKTTGLDPAMILQLESVGLLAPAMVAHKPAFTALDVRVAGAMSGLLARGVDVRLLGSLRRNVEREIGVVDDLVQPLRVRVRQVRSRGANDDAAAVATEVAVLRSILLERALGEYLGG
jgi:DNA-binding transcriptional MerR regulator